MAFRLMASKAMFQPDPMIEFSTLYSLQLSARFSVAVNLSEYLVHDPRRQEDFPVRDGSRIFRLNAVIEFADQFGHSRVLIELAAHKISKIAPRIRQMLPGAQ